MKYLVFETQADADAAEKAISANMGFCEHCSSTKRWDVPRQIADGRWVIQSWDDNGVEASEDWFATQSSGMPMHF